MSDLYTAVQAPECCGYMARDRVTRVQAIAEARRYYEAQRDEAERFLATDDGAMRVQVQRGVYAVHLVEVLS